jgi:iron-sulfur cluster assembly protein
MITLTAEAAAQIRNAAQQSGAEGSAIRIAAKLDSDGEMQYGMGFDDEREHDVMVETAGITVLVSEHSKELLDGVTLDYVEIQPGVSTFVFLHPPKEESAAEGGCGSAGGCGCNSSGG